MADEQSQDVLAQPQSVEDTIEAYEPPPDDPSGGGDIPPPPSGYNLRLIIMAALGILILIGIAVGIWSFLRGGTGGGSGNGDAVITYWGLWEPADVIQPIINDFERENPGIQVAYELHSPTQYRERLQAAIARGEGPDVFRYHNTWIPMLENELAPIPHDVLSPEEAQSIYYAPVVDDLTLNDQLVGITFGIDTLMLYYNLDMLEDENLTAPETWDEFDRVANRLTEKNDAGSIIRSGAAIGTAENVEHFSDIIGLIMYQNGVSFPALTSSPAVQALEFYTLFAMPPQNIWDAEQENSIVAFASEQTAMVFAPSWQVDVIRSINPDLNFDTAPVPQLAGATPVSWGTYWAEGVSSQSSSKDAAFEFVSYLSEQDTMTKLFSEASKLESRAFGEPYARSDLSDQLSQTQYLEPVAQQAPNMRSWYFASRTQDNGINDSIIRYLKDAVNAVHSGSSAQGAMETASQGVNQILEDYNAANN